jgi:hypothetical protein
MQKKYPVLVFFVISFFAILMTGNVLADSNGSCSAGSCTSTLDTAGGYAEDHADCSITGGLWNSSRQTCDLSAQTCTADGGTWDPQAGQCNLPLVSGSPAASTANQVCTDSGGHVDSATGRCITPTTVTPKSALPGVIAPAAVGIAGVVILRRKRD